MGRLGWMLALLASAPSVLADSGQIACHNANGLTGTVSASLPDPEAAGFDRQDCTLGSSAAQALGVGFAKGIAARGRDWTKLDGSGAALPDTAASWACLRDNESGLVWEIKTDDGGLRDKDHTYAWRSTDASQNGGNSGPLGSDTCAGTLPAGQCNTEAYVAAVNAAGLCGASDWRMPSIVELDSLSDLGINPRPAINPSLFPNSLSVAYWSATSRASNSNGAWVIVLDGGRREAVTKSGPAAIRLVRSSP
ncbi:DUF1566 domain-containing protein [Pseudomarimonas salicorniae]|uniref:DUF1566 domain-containing protein n=1 Tax=Pseudomarimonas salicorniae TaxID=2933270 RepID=A0ABT0GLK6_9GAMM|nr:DUF1566 domain-containing protein [Lysobacter sp. CAU 1642]MCK7595396.1 DUF1566 domain-containing protein [Lysobacter sp. CAU 1642]